MQQKQRPFSSKPSTKIPIIVDQSYVESQVSHKGFQLTSQSSKIKLNQIIPQLPAFGIKSNSTALLYSKFIVKGLKQDKLTVVKSALKKKQEITEAGTTLYNNKSRISHKNIKQGKSVTGTRTVQILETFPFEQNEMNQRNGIQNKQLHNLLRASSAKVFRKINNRQTIVQNQRILVKNSTQANLHKQNKKRPTTAKPAKQKDLRLSHGLSSQELRLFMKKQIKNVAHQNVRYIFTPSLDQLDPLISKKLVDKPLKVQSNYSRDHIERNIRNISTYTRKTSSIYLTNANIQNLIIKKSQQKLKRQQKVEQQNKNHQSNILQPKPQQLFSIADKSTHQNKLHQIQKYLKQSSPTKYHLLNSEIRKQQNKNKLQISQYYDELLSKDIDYGYQHSLIKSQTEINEKDAIACNEEYIKNCEILQYNISTKLKTQQINNNNNTTINVCECQQIISIYRKIIQTQSKTKKQQYIQQIRKITKNLKYFADKPQKEIDKFFTLPFEIVIVDQGQQIIQLNSPVSHIYIILNGSVIVQSNTNNDKQSFSKYLMTQNIFNTHHSLYDGQAFGQPSKPSQQYYKNRVTTLQQSLLLIVKYEDYIRQFFQGSEIQQKLQVLNLAFKMEINSGIFYDQDLQMLSLSLEKHRFSSKSLIFRQGEIFEKLMIVAKGKLCIINEFILTKDKMRIYDMKQIDKNIRQPKQQHILINSNSKTKQKNTIQETFLHQQFQTDLTIQRMRRQNLINYQILRQDVNKITYYFMKQQTTYVKGDILNWQSIIPSSRNQANNNFLQQGKQQYCSLTHQPLRYSLISNSDETEIYFLTKTSYEYLPNNIKKILSQKGKQKCKKEQKIQTEKEVKQWNNYKNKLCNRIIKQHKERNKSKHRF